MEPRLFRTGVVACALCLFAGTAHARFLKKVVLDKADSSGAYGVMKGMHQKRKIPFVHPLKIFPYEVCIQNNGAGAIGWSKVFDARSNDATKLDVRKTHAPGTTYPVIHRGEAPKIRWAKPIARSRSLGKRARSEVTLYKVRYGRPTR